MMKIEILQHLTPSIPHLGDFSAPFIKGLLRVKKMLFLTYPPLSGECAMKPLGEVSKTSSG